MTARINVALVIGAMHAKGWKARRTYIECGLNSKTLAKILDGEVPSRLDALYRLADGLGLKIEEVIINEGAALARAKRQGWSLLRNRRAISKIDRNEEKGPGPSAA